MRMKNTSNQRYVAKPICDIATSKLDFCVQVITSDKMVIKAHTIRLCIYYLTVSFFSPERNKK